MCLARAWFAKKRASLEEVSEAGTSGCCTATTGIGNAIINNEITITDNDNDATNAAGDNEENAFASNKFCIEQQIAKNAKKNIKDDLRIGKHVPFQIGHILQYYHVECAFESFLRAKVSSNSINNMTELDGIDLITNDEKTRIEKLIQETISMRTKPFTEGPVVNLKPVSMMNTPQCRLNMLKCTNLPSMKLMFTNADQLTTSKMTELRKKN